MELIGHERQRQWFRNAIAGKRLGSTFLLVGPEGIGKRRFVYWLTQSLFCENGDRHHLTACETCSQCAQVKADTHPDILKVSKHPYASVILVEDLIGRRENRMKEGLCFDLHLKPMFGDRRVAIIDDADLLKEVGSNALLKTLEEPPINALIFLIGTSAQRQLPTIRSRCQIVRFDPPSIEEAIQILRIREAGMEHLSTDQEKRLALELADGDLGKAFLYLDEVYRDFRNSLYENLNVSLPAAITLAKLLNRFVEGAGKEAPLRRARLRFAGDLCAEFYRQQMQHELQTSSVAFDEERGVLYRLNRCLELRSEVDSNANQATLIESWAYDLQRGQPV